ncbi:MAG TPA: DMT family transporter [Spirochaetia bacterium]|nr:DMT family transporter [Spirochaetia bacterium]
MADEKRTAAAIAGNCFAMLFYGLSFLWTKVAFKYCGPFTVIFVRLVLSSAFLAIVDALRIRGRTASPGHSRIERKDFVSLVILSLFMPFLYFVGENLGLMSVSPAVAATIIALIPVVTPLMSRIFLAERVGILAVAGMILSLAGVLLMIKNGLADASATVGGACLVFLAVLAASLGAVAVRKLPLRLSGITIVKYQNFFGALMFLPLFLFYEAGEAVLILPAPELYWSLGALALLPSTVSYLFYNNAIRVLGPARASVFSNAVPVIAAAFSAIVLGEKFGAVKILGMGIALVGVAISQIRNS